MSPRGWSAAIALTCALTTACTSDTQPPPPQDAQVSVSPMDQFPVGSTGDFAIYPHCGVEFAHIDGMLWRTRPRGHGNPPPWPVEAFSGTLTRPKANLAVFTSAALPVNRLVFRPAPDASYMCA
jgi:hypothetical protein